MCKKKDKFYIQTNPHYQKNGNWFKKQVVGINSIATIMPKMIKTAGIESSKRLTNNSARKHLLTKLACTCSSIHEQCNVQLSGRKNITTKMLRKRQNKISDILSHSGKTMKITTTPLDMESSARTTSTITSTPIAILIPEVLYSSWINNNPKSEPNTISS